MTAVSQIQYLDAKPNAESIFWARVRFDIARHYAPAGQVNPPPQPKKAPPSTILNATQDDIYTYG